MEIVRWATSSAPFAGNSTRSEEHTSELQSQSNLVCRLLLEKKKKEYYTIIGISNYLTSDLQIYFIRCYLSCLSSMTLMVITYKMYFLSLIRTCCSTHILLV